MQRIAWSKVAAHIFVNLGVTHDRCWEGCKVTRHRRISAAVFVGGKAEQVGPVAHPRIGGQLHRLLECHRVGGRGRAIALHQIRALADEAGKRQHRAVAFPSRPLRRAIRRGQGRGGELDAVGIGLPTPHFLHRVWEKIVNRVIHRITRQVNRVPPPLERVGRRFPLRVGGGTQKQRAKSKKNRFHGKVKERGHSCPH